MRIEENVVVAAPVEDVWVLISDPLVLGELDAGVIIEADNPLQPPGLRARYRALLRVGPVPVGGDVEIVEYVPGRELAWNSLTGIDQRFRLRIRPIDDGRTRLTLRFGYTSPGALGVIADIAAFGQVRGVLRGMLRTLRTEAERRARRQRQSRRAVKPKRPPARASRGKAPTRGRRTPG
jgi:uncharacterized membrane protein